MWCSHIKFFDDIYEDLVLGGSLLDEHTFCLQNRPHPMMIVPAMFMYDSQHSIFPGFPTLYSYTRCARRPPQSFPDPSSYLPSPRECV